MTQTNVPPRPTTDGDPFEQPGSSPPPDTLFRPFGEVDPGEAEPRWLWRPFVAPGAITIVAGPPKIGKTETVVGLLGAMSDGAGSYLGAEVRSARTVYLTEEGLITFGQKVTRLGLGPEAGVVLSQRKARDIPWADRWDGDAGAVERGVVSLAVEQARRIGAELLVIDTLTAWTGIADDGENDAGRMRAAFEPLSVATEHGLAVVVVVQSRKSGGQYGAGIRGSTEILGSGDVALEIARPSRASRDGPRVVSCVGRFDELPDRFTIRRAEDGRLETTTGAPEVEPQGADGPRLMVEVALMDGPRTVLEVVERTGLDERAVRRILMAMHGEDAVTRSGRGLRGDPHRLALAQGVSGESGAPIGSDVQQAVNQGF